MNETSSDPYSLYAFSLRSPVTRERYTYRLGKFFDFLGMAGTTQERCQLFVERSKENGWLAESIMRFFQFQKERVERKEISGATVQNFVKCIKLFLEVNDNAIVRELPGDRVQRNSGSTLTVLVAPELSEGEYSYVLEVRRELQNGQALGTSTIFTVSVK